MYQAQSGTKIADVTSPYTHTGLTQGTTYYYVVTAANGYGESADSAKVSVTIPDYRKDVCVAMGDSITEGTISRSIMPTAMCPDFPQLWGKTVYNEGVAGALSSYGANVIDSILAQYNPKYITIFYGTQ